MRTFGRYRLVEPLATGGMAEVWRAEAAGAEGVVKEVALKLVRGEYAAESAFVRMFVQEARLAARLGHANVVQVFEFDQVDGRYYIAMELVRGRDLGRVAERARERGARLGVPRAVHVAVEVAKALAYAHRLSEAGRPLGLVHRDVSPHNVLVSFEGEVKLADFGIARAMNLADMTVPGTIKGKAAYMAPEQARGAPVDGRADVFALGVVLWELCAGRRLFARDSDAATIAAVLSSEAASPPSAWNEEVPPDLDRAVLGALEKDPERRTRSARELAADLSAVLLRVTRSPEDADLRAFMQRIFPDEATPAAAPEPTKVRPVPVAREPVAGPVRPAAAEETATRTARSPAVGRARAGRGAIAAVAIALAAGGAVMAARQAARRGPTGPAGGSEAATAPLTAGPGAPAAPPDPAGANAAERASAAPPSPEPGRDAPAGAPRPPAAEPEAARPVARAGVVGGLRVPPVESGDGILTVTSTRWGRVRVNDLDLGFTPVELRIRAGRHHVAVWNPKFGVVEGDAVVEAGRRSALNLAFRVR